MVDWFLTTSFVQWVSVLLTGWSVVREDDPRIHRIEGVVAETTRNPAGRKSRGVFSGWWSSERWNVFDVRGGSCNILVKTPKGRLLAYWGKTYFPGDRFALGSCREPLEVQLFLVEPGQGSCARLSLPLPLDRVDRDLPEYAGVDWL
jgi:hypothetical protein